MDARGLQLIIAQVKESERETSQKKLVALREPFEVICKLLDRFKVRFRFLIIIQIK